MIVNARNPRGEQCSFNTETHQYWCGIEPDKESVALGEMTPVTKLISQFYTVGPWNGVKCDVEFGNRIHAIVRDCLKGEKPSVMPTDDERPSFSAAWKYAKRLGDYNEVRMVEDIVFSTWVGVAGMVDIAFVCNGQLYICDWKTGDLMLPAKCKFNAPFDHLVADPVTIYSLQCSMYQVLADIGGYSNGVKLAPARLLWLHNGEDGKPRVDALTCRDLRREAAEMISMRSYTQWFKDWEKRQPW